MSREPLIDLTGRLSRRNLLGSFLTDFLKAEDVTQSELCRRLDIPASLLTQWLNGHDAIPQLQIIRVKEALGLDNDDFTALCYLNNIILLRLGLLASGPRCSAP